LDDATGRGVAPVFSILHQSCEEANGPKVPVSVQGGNHNLAAGKIIH
jgi:hypothetical protein